VARAEGVIARLPNAGARVASTPRRFGACVLERHGAFLVRQRPADVVNGHLWEFPNVELPLNSSSAAARQLLETELGCRLDVCSPFMTVKHTITRYRITLQAFRGQLNGTAPRDGAGQWVPKKRLDSLSFTGAHRRVLEAALAG
jgi:adenine-specific DNA glycosylase